MKGSIGKVNRATDSRGAILPLVAMTALLLIGLVAVVINISYSRFVGTQLQITADAIAHAAAVSLCSSRTCWYEAREAGLEALRREIAAGPLGNSGVKPSIIKQADPRFYEVGKYKVTIEIGRWLPDDPPGSNTRHFESVEDPQFELDHPNTPPVLATNAVQVTVKQENINMFLAVFGNSQYTKEAAAVATGREIAQEVCVAPFAIHACALLNNNDDYDATSSCEIDRYFTSTVGLPQMPDFMWHPASFYRKSLSRVNFKTCEELFDPGGGPTELKGLQACREIRDTPPAGKDVTYEQDNLFRLSAIDRIHLTLGFDDVHGSQNYVDQSRLSGIPFADAQPINVQYTFRDTFGFVGLPGAGAVTEAAIDSALRTKMAQCGGDIGLVPASLGQAFSILPGGLTNGNTQTSLYNAIKESTGEYRRRLEDTDLTSALVKQVGEAASGAQALCNSWFFDESKFSDLCSITPTTSPLRPDPEIENAYSPTGLIRDAAVWHVPVPVIARADTTVETCAAFDNRPLGTGPDLTAPYEIIGFAYFDIFDADIGTAPPARPASPVCDPWAGTVAPWSYPQSCNLVRARTSCEPELIATDITQTPKKPFLVK